MNERQKMAAALRAAKNNELKKHYFQYILDSISSDDVDVSKMSDKEKIEFAFKMFYEEKVKNDRRNIPRLDLLTEWLQGLCSTVSIAFSYCDIREIAHSWHVHSSMGDFVENWFKNVATMMFRLAEELGVDIEKYM